MTIPNSQQCLLFRLTFADERGVACCSVRIFLLHLKGALFLHVQADLLTGLYFMFLAGVLMAQVQGQSDRAQPKSVRKLKKSSIKN